ncbi:HAD family hydrolase [Chitinophaga sp.]|uniref:D-glycero-alpha-D-manno-heptose-1,7-bisphosphate 7-phosphatase n=1 Tax=Chitinophaga sp. TaxID=1869181 RepID=UPI0031CED2FB
MRKAIFIDKDGTLIQDVPYNVDPDQIVLEQHAGRAMQLFSEQGFMLVVITNQSGIARGYFKEEQLAGVQQKINALLRAYNVRLDGFFYCPHHPQGTIRPYAVDCSCRKPRSGMLKAAAEKLNIDLTNSWMIGDILHDVEAGNQAGCRSLLVNNGHETEWTITPQRRPVYIASNLLDAAQFIIKVNGHDASISFTGQ